MPTKRGYSQLSQSQSQSQSSYKNPSIINDDTKKKLSQLDSTS